MNKNDCLNVESDRGCRYLRAWEYDATTLVSLARELGEGEHSRGMFGGSLVFVKMLDSPETWKVLTKGMWLPVLEMTFGADRLWLCQRGIELLCGKDREVLADEITGYAKEVYLKERNQLDAPSPKQTELKMD